MKYCSQCGNQLLDEAIVCPQCGCAAEPARGAGQNASGLQIAAKVFMVLGCISYACMLFPLIWTLPMTIHYFKATSKGEPVGTGFKVCSLLFVNLIAGILMLCDTNNQKY